MSIDVQSRSLWHRIPAQLRAAFFSCFFTGLLVHLYAFTNLIPNSDGLSRVFDPQYMLVSGRWFLHTASMPNAFTQMPMVIGLLSLLFLGLAAALTVDLLKIRGLVLSGLIGAVMAAFPALGYTYLYMFTASAYGIGIFLAVLSLWLICRGGNVRLTLGVVALAFSMGTYQAYVTLAIGLSLLVVLREILTPESTLESTFKLGFRLIFYLACGALLYYCILLVLLNIYNVELLDYRGIEGTSSGYPFAMLPALLFATYKQFIAFFFLPGSPDAFATPMLVLLDLAALVLGTLLFFRRIAYQGMLKDLWRLVLSILVLALFPLGVNFSQILSPSAPPTPIMKYSFVLVYVAVLLLADLRDAVPRGEKEVLHRWTLPLTVVWTAAILLFSLNTNNLLDTASAQAHRATESYMTRLVTRIESCPGYEPGMEIAVVGAVPADQIRSSIPSYNRVDHYSVPMSYVTVLNKHIYYYLNDWLNFPVIEPSEETMINISRSLAFRNMPLYPAPDSIQVMNGRLVVKMQKQYTPKAQFELDYENRR